MRTWRKDGLGGLQGRGQLLALWVLCALAVAPAVAHQPVAQASFGRDGKEILRAGWASSAPKQAVGYPGGRILVSLELFGAGKDPAIVRVGPNGSVDRTFGNKGRAAIGNALSEINDIAVQQDGAILAVGSRNAGRAPRTTEAVIVRLLPNGKLDHSFSGDGMQSIGLEGTFQEATAVAAMPSGTILFAGSDGYVSRESTLSPTFIVRLRSDGRLDSSFATGGMLRLADGAPVGDLEPSAGGSALVATGVAAEPALRRLDAGGSFDPAFGEAGTVRVDRAGTASNEPLFTPIGEIAESADGSIYIGGSTSFIDADHKFHFGVAVIRYLADGTRDYSYGSNGVARAAFDGKAFAAALAVQPGGKAVVVGNSGPGFAAACFDTYGRRERGFGQAGVATLRVDGSSRAEGVVLQSRGRVVLVGLSQNAKRKSGYNQTALARLRIDRTVR